MVKWILGLLIGAGLIVAGIYILTPSSIVINNSRLMKANRSAVARFMIEENRWREYWPGVKDNPTVTDSSFTFNGYSYTISDKSYSSLLIRIAKNNQIIANTTLLITDSTVNYIKMQWHGFAKDPANPLARWNVNAEAKDLEKDMGKLLDKMQAFFSDLKNIYGINIQRERVQDSTLIFTYDTARGYPGVEHIYNLLDQLKNYIAVKGAKSTGFPMLNIYTADSITYRTKVAIPVDKKLPSKGLIAYRWMLGGGYILTTEVKGGNYTVTQALLQVDNFAKDYHHIPPAIPFFSLITDRRMEKDSTKWLTKIYYPIME